MVKFRYYAEVVGSVLDQTSYAPSSRWGSGGATERKPPAGEGEAMSADRGAEAPEGQAGASELNRTLTSDQSSQNPNSSGIQTLNGCRVWKVRKQEDKATQQKFVQLEDQRNISLCILNWHLVSYIVPIEPASSLHVYIMKCIQPGLKFGLN